MKDAVTLSKSELVALVQETAKDLTATAVAEIKAQNEKDLAAIKGGNKFSYKGSFASLSEEQKAKLGAKEKMASFITALYNKDVSSLAEFKANMNETTGSAGGFLVPTEFAAEVFRIVEDFGLVSKLATKFPMNAAQLNVPRVSASVTVSYPGEATAGTASQPTLQQVQLISKTLVGICPMSNELLADANVSVVDLLIELFAEAIAGEIDKQGLVGTGSPFTGVTADSGVTIVQPANGTGNSTFTGAATPDNCRTLISNVKPWALQGAAFVMHRTVWGLIQVTKASTAGDYFASAANPIVSPNAVAGYPTAMAGTLWGYPVYLSDKMPTTTAVSTVFIIFGNLKHIFLGQREELGVLISDTATVGSDNLFSQNMSAVRVTHRHAIAVGLPAAFACLKTSAS